jgi:signal transduction histidine kinase
MTLRDAALLRQVLATVQGAPSLAYAINSITRAANALEDVPESEEAHKGLRPRGRTFYDHLIEQILERVKSAVSREELLEFVMEALGESGVGQSASGYLLMSTNVDSHGELTNMRVVRAVGFHPARMDNFITKRMEALAESPLLQAVLTDQREVEFLSTELTRGYSYDGEFDDLISDKRRGAWVCAIPLPSLNQRNANRMLVALYPVVGLPEQPALPKGANQEWRVFGFLRLAYELLNHQLESVAEQVLMQRREILADLGPGIVNHEINQQLTILDQTTKVMNISARELELKICAGDTSFLAIVQGIALTQTAIGRLHRIAHAFNNLERRDPKATVSLITVVDEVMTLLHYRLARYGIVVDVDDTGYDLVVETDIALVEHVVLNVVSNAIDAFDEDLGRSSIQKADNDGINGDEESPKSRIISIKFGESDEFVDVIIANNGPPISGVGPQTIFEKGITSKPYGVGHGLGLFVCRLVMNFLGGTIALLADDERVAGMNVGFLVTLPRIPRIDELMADSKILRQPTYFEQKKRK